jgi:hypothetical protein
LKPAHPRTAIQIPATRRATPSPTSPDHGETIRAGEPSFDALANSWIIVNVGGGPTEDKPTVTLETPPDPDRTSTFLNIRVADIQAIYAEWSARGAEFLTPPQDRGGEIRCYIRDPDGHLIEVGQTSPGFLEQIGKGPGRPRAALAPRAPKPAFG